MTDLWFSLPQKLRFLLAGGFNTAVGYGLVFLGQYCLGGYVFPQVIFGIGYMISSLSSFTVMKHLVFRTSGNYLREYIKYLSSSVTSALIGLGALSLVVHFFGGNEYLGQFMGMSASVVTSYVLLQYYAFASKTRRDGF